MARKSSKHQISDGGNSVFNSTGLSKMKKAFCKCGEITDFDSSQMLTKLCLGKELECPSCRNARVSGDIDEMNVYYENTRIKESCQQHSTVLKRDYTLYSPPYLTKT